MTLKGGSSQACAACKYQRRRCSSECPLAPYFPADEPKLFQNAHKLFGVSNIVKILKPLDTHHKGEAMRSIIYQSFVRDRSPVHGCLGVTRHLQYAIWVAEEELRTVNAQLEMYRQEQQQQQQQQQISNLVDNNDIIPTQLDLGMAPPNNVLSLFNDNVNSPQPYNGIIAQQQSYSVSSNVGYSYSYIDSKEEVANSLWAQQNAYANLNNNNNNNNNTTTPMGVQSQLVSHSLDQQEEVVHDYDGIHPFFDTIDDRQSYIDSKDAYESSSEESLKDTTQSVEHVSESKLKSAAPCFSLTSVN